MKMECIAKEAQKIVPGDLIFFGDYKYHVVSKIEVGSGGLLIYSDELTKPMKTRKTATIVGGQAADGYKFAKCLQSGDIFIVEESMGYPQALTVGKIERNGKTVSIYIRDYVAKFDFDEYAQIKLYKGKLIHGRPIKNFWRYGNV